MGTSDPIEHWWIVLATDFGYYVIQKWSKGSIIMSRVEGECDANQNGLACVGKTSDSRYWTVKS